MKTDTKVWNNKRKTKKDYVFNKRKTKSNHNFDKIQSKNGIKQQKYRLNDFARKNMALALKRRMQVDLKNDEVPPFYVHFS